MGTTVPARRRPKRSTEEIRDAILDVASRLFDEQGYRSTTTLEIGRRARVSERLIFAHFGSKIGLFNAAVIAPFAEVIAGYVDSWLADAGDLTPEQRVDYLVTGLYDRAREHRIALLTALAENHAGPNTPDRLLDQLGHTFQRMLAITPPPNYSGLDLPALLSTVVGMIFGAAILEEMIFPSGTEPPSRERLITEMRTTLIDGMRDRA